MTTRMKTSRTIEVNRERGKGRENCFSMKLIYKFIDDKGQHVSFPCDTLDKAWVSLGFVLDRLDLSGFRLFSITKTA